MLLAGELFVDLNAIGDARIRRGVTIGELLRGLYGLQTSYLGQTYLAQQLAHLATDPHLADNFLLSGALVTLAYVI